MIKGKKAIIFRSLCTSGMREKGCMLDQVDSNLVDCIFLAGKKPRQLIGNKERSG